MAVTVLHSVDAGWKDAAIFCHT